MAGAGMAKGGGMGHQQGHYSGSVQWLLRWQYFLGR